MSLTIATAKREGGGHIVAPSGRLDSTTYQQLDEKLKPYLNGGTKVLILDLKNLEYLSSAGLRVIFKAWKNIVGHGGSFTMTNLQPQIETVFDIIKALPKESVFSSMEEVDSYLDAIQRKQTENRGPAQS